MVMAKEILCGFGIDVDAVAGWLGSYGGEDSPDGVMRDAIDVPAVLAALADVGLASAGQLDDTARQRVEAVLAKADPSSSGRIRGARHVMLEDSDISATQHARALVGGVLAGIIGRTDLFVSGGAEHQGPDGGGPVAIIARRKM
jgi:cyanuric acid amidohydrolase